MKQYIDTHCHLLTEYFSRDEIETLILRAQKQNINKIIVPATTWKNSLETIRLSKKYPHVYAAIGIHPSEATVNFTKDNLKKINLKQIIAVGEVGLDFYWKDNPPLKTQAKVLEIFLDFAMEHKLPALIHMRNSEKELYAILSKFKYQNLKFVIHSFTSTYEWAQKFIDLGGLISFSGIVTFKNAHDLQLIAKKIPLNKILVETDSPFLTPVPHRGKQNEPSYVKHVADFIADLRDEDSDFVIKVLYENTLKFFNL